MGQDRQFLSAALAAAVEPFGHREHVRVAFAAARATGCDPELTAVICRSVIRAIAEQAGATGKYHETLTVAWATAVCVRVAQWAPEGDFGWFIGQHPELLDRDLLLAHYSPELLFGDAARARWIEPDRAPLAG